MKEETASPGSRFSIKNKKFIKVASLSLLGSVVLLAIVGWNADWGLLRHSLLHVSPAWLASAAFFMVVMQCVAGMRLASLLPNKDLERDVKLPAIEVAFHHQALIKLMPFRLGEAAFFWLVNKKLGTPFDRNLGAFLRFRLWDLRVVAVSFILSAGWIAFHMYDWLKVYIAIVCVWGLVFFMLSPSKILSLFNKIFRLLTLLPCLGFMRHFSEMVSQAIACIDADGQAVSENNLFILSLGIWLCYFAVFYSLMQGLGMTLSPILAIAVASGMTLVSIIPFQTIGGLGLVEIGQSSLYILAGLPAAEAASRSLAVSGLFLLLCLWASAMMWLSITCFKVVSSRK